MAIEGFIENGELVIELPEECIQIKQIARDFAIKNIDPYRLEWDEKNFFPVETLREMGKLGLLGIIIPQEWGGAGLSYMAYVSAIAEIASHCGAIGLSMAAHTSLCTNHINLWGNNHQKEKYLKKLAKGEYIGCWALSEPETGSDAFSMKTTAEFKNGKWILNGVKAWATHGISADVYVIFAALKGVQNKKERVCAFIVEKGTKGLIPAKKENKMGMRASETAQIILDNCEVPEDNLIGKAGTGMKQALTVLNGGRISIAALATGIARGAFEIALQYAKTRVQFDVPIIQHQAIGFKLANMYVRLRASELLTYRAAYLMDNNSLEPAFASMAKYYSSETATWLTDEAIQILGGNGYVKEYLVEKFHRDAKLCTIGEGTSEIQKLNIAKYIKKIYSSIPASIFSAP